MNAVSFKTISTLDELLTLSATHHHNICPRQVLGVRAGLLAGLLLDLPLPQPDKRLIAIAETDGCFVDGISAATGCYIPIIKARCELMKQEIKRLKKMHF